MNRTKADTMFEDKLCQWGFNYSEVVPCLLSLKDQRDPVYELRRDGSGLPFENILRLRAEKIRNFLSTKDYKNVHSLIAVKYEELVLHEGFKRLVERITFETGLPFECDLSQVSLPLPVMEDKVEYEKEYVDWINEEADWLAEMKLKYKMGERFQFPKEVVPSIKNNTAQSENKTKTQEKKNISVNQTKAENKRNTTKQNKNPSSKRWNAQRNKKGQASSQNAKNRKTAPNQKKKTSDLPASHLKSTNWHRDIRPPFTYKKDSGKSMKKKQSP